MAKEITPTVTFPPLVLSPSRAKKWVRCKKEYYWRYNQKLVKFRKSMMPTLGLTVGEALAEYYGVVTGQRSSEVLSLLTEKVITIKEPKALRENDKAEWEKIKGISRTVLSRYHPWALTKDNFTVDTIEQPYEISLGTSGNPPREIRLLAIPDAVVITNNDHIRLIFEHKLRSRYRTGDFGFDYQSAACCLVAVAAGTLFNIIKYKNLKFERELIIRSDYEVNYFANLFLTIGHEILTTPPECMYPMPMKRCACEYFELCMAEKDGADVQDIIDSYFVTSTYKVETTPIETKEVEEE